MHVGSTFCSTCVYCSGICPVCLLKGVESAGEYERAHTFCLKGPAAGEAAAVDKISLQQGCLLLSSQTHVPWFDAPLVSTGSGRPLSILCVLLPTFPARTTLHCACLAPCARLRPVASPLPQFVSRRRCSPTGR